MLKPASFAQFATQEERDRFLRACSGRPFTLHDGTVWTARGATTRFNEARGWSLGQKERVLKEHLKSAGSKEPVTVHKEGSDRHIKVGNEVAFTQHTTDVDGTFSTRFDALKLR